MKAGPPQPHPAAACSPEREQPQRLLQVGELVTVKLMADRDKKRSAVSNYRVGL